MSSKSIYTILPTLFARLGSSCYVLVILAIFQTFFIIFVIVICDQGLQLAECSGDG